MAAALTNKEMNMRRWIGFPPLAIALVGSLAFAADGSPFSHRGELVRPADYRSWVFVTSGLGMNYGPSKPKAADPPQFTNVFVNPQAYRGFMQSGVWPEGTVFILEVRKAEQEVSVDNNGRTQGAVVALEAAAKDSSRYPDGGWAYFSFDSNQGLRPSAAPLPRTANCYACHSQNAAVEWTFTQFYPEQMAVAKAHGTVRRDYDPARKVASE